MATGNFSLLQFSNGNFAGGTKVSNPFFIGFGVSGKIGKPTAPNPLGLNGIYQMRMTRRGKIPLRMRFYKPTNPRSPAQQANRQKFADAMTSWGTLTDEQKATYNRRAKKRQMFGWGLFIREYYQSH